MPWCPVCAEEFEAGVARCSDCGAFLVPEPPLPELPDDPALPEELIRGRLRASLEVVVRFLDSQSIPAEIVSVPPEDDLEGGFALVTSARLWEPAVAAILSFIPSSTAPAQDDAPDLARFIPDSLNSSLKDIIDRGEDLLADLAKGLLLGDLQMQTKSEYALVRMGDPARRFLLDLLLDAVRDEDPARVRRLSRTLAQFSDPETLPAVLALLDRHEHIVPVVTALGYLNDPRAVPALVHLLDHEDVSVRDEAAESLYNITGKTFDFEADDPPDRRQRAVSQWWRWMSRHDVE